jgi:hypothetical protein
MAEGALGWAPEIAAELSARHIEDLLAQKISYVRIPGFLSADWCEEITRRFRAFAEQHPDHRVHLRPTKAIDVTIDAVVFPMNFFVQTRPVRLQEYLARVPGDRPSLRAIYEGGTDPFERVRAYWQGAGWTVLPAFEGSRPYHTDVLWGTVNSGESPPHVDTYHLETECSLSRYPQRFSCNAFIQPPESGGNFKVFKLRREDLPSGTRDLPPDTPCAEYEVKAGDLVVFDAGNYHAVAPCFGKRHRLCAHMAVGIDRPARECSIFA